MPKWNVDVYFSACKTVEVEADSYLEAREKGLVMIEEPDNEDFSIEEIECYKVWEKENNKMNAWERNANTAKEIYGSYIDYKKRFYICPNCEEPVYEEDWQEETMATFMCPICEEPLYEKE